MSGHLHPSEANVFPRFPEAYAERWISAGLWKNRTLHDCFDETVSAQPGRVVITTRQAKLTLAEFKEQSDALAAGLLGAEVCPGDLVAVQLPNWPEFCFLQIALSRIGAVIQPTHLVFREREIRSLYEFCQTDVAIVPESFGGHDYAKTMRAISGDLPRLRQLVVVRGSAHGESEHELAALIEDGRRNLNRLESVSVDPNDVFYLNFTSGTEGNPKGFLHTHNSLISLFKTTAEIMSKLDPTQVNLACSPMTHSYGHFTTYQAALGAIPMVLVDRYRPIEVLELIEATRATAISGTPAHLFAILHHPEFARFDTSSVKSVGLGGARSSPALIEDLERIWGTQSANTYGMGETIVHTRTMPFDPEEKARTTVGKPVLGAELKIVDPEEHAKELGPGEVGEIVFRGPTLFVGYHRQPELTSATRDDEGWFYTGDLGSVDAEGYLSFAGRAKEVINRGGSKIYPKVIEDLLTAHPRVLQAAVVGFPDKRLGERVCAYVVPEGDGEITIDELHDYLRSQKVTKYLFPEFVFNLTELPMTPTGKVRKAALQDDVAERAHKLEEQSS